MKVAYLTNADPEDQYAWSGSSYYMRRSLELAGLDVETIGSLSFPRALWPERLVRYAAERIGWSRDHIWTFEPRVIRHQTQQIERRLAHSKADVILSCSSMLVTQLKTSRPIYFWADATFAAMLDYYFKKNEITEATLRNGNSLEGSAIRNSAGAFYASSWAADSAVRDYHSDPGRVYVVPLGANLQQEPTAEEVGRWIECRPMEPCRLFFIGVDWIRKGGDHALAVAEILNRNGLRCELTIAGCRPPRDVVLPPFVKSLGFIDKSTADGLALLRKCFSESHFLIAPSRAECFGLVFSEAGAHGVPSLSTQTGGIPTAVVNGVNGYCIPMGAALISELASKIARTMDEPEKYRTLARSAYRDYVNRLNWKTSGLKIRGIMEKTRGRSDHL